MQASEVEAAYRRYFPVIRAKCARMLGDSSEAQDVAQETFARLWHARAGVGDVLDPRDADDPGDPAAVGAPATPHAVVGWIYRTATRLAVDRHRQRARTGALTDQEEIVGADLNDGTAARDLLRRLARRLPADELEALILHRVDGLTQPEIAEVLGSSERTVRRLLSKADERVQRITKGDA